MWHGDNLFYWKIVGILACFKGILFPAYRSTDFEVHRNWLAITHSLPVSEWYRSNVSQWTLDYPPLFAWLEKALSYPAFLVDPKMLEVENLNYQSKATIIFQRYSVIITELVYVYAVYCFMNFFKERNKSSKKSLPYHFMLALIFLTNFGLLLVDHIHFQYNGILFGIMLLSILKIYEGKPLCASFWFAVLLCMKHIYLYVAPVYGIFLLKNCIFDRKGQRFSLKTFFKKLTSLGLVVTCVFAVTFLPFVYLGQLSEVISRLFPFKRGLCHAYWAPNFWAVYNVADKGFSAMFRHLGYIQSTNHSQASMTGGLVQEFDHTFLPSIKPLHTFIATLACMLPALKVAWQQKRGAESFVRSVVLCAYASFLFGWHVHEKAIIIVIVPLTLLIFISKNDAKNFLFLTFVANFSLFPLIFTEQEMLLKYGICFVSLLLSFYSISTYYKTDTNFLKFPLMTIPESLYLIGLIFLEVYSVILHGMIFRSALPFLPLMLRSFYCSLGLLYVWFRMFVSYE